LALPAANFGASRAISDSAQPLDVTNPVTDSDFNGLCLKTCMPEQPIYKKSEKRQSRRVKIAKPVRVRPSDPRDEHFEDLPVSVNASKEGIFFVTRRSNYYKGMRVFVTFPFASSHDPMNCEYVAEVVRVEEQPNGKFGVAVKLLMTMNYSASAKTNSVSRI